MLSMISIFHSSFGTVWERVVPTYTPWAAAVHLGQVGQLAEDGLVAERHEDEAVMGERAHRCDGCALLPTAGRAGGDEEAGVLALQIEDR